MEKIKRPAIFLDRDGVLIVEKDFLVDPDDIEFYPETIRALSAIKDDYIKIVVSNQSGIATGALTAEMARKCFERTNKLLGFDIDFRFCPHGFPPSCYCRKPQSGLGLALICEYNLDPSKCIMVGDKTTDRTFAKRLGMEYSDASEFFNQK